MGINQQIAIKGAELLKIYYSYSPSSGEVYVIHDNESMPREFDPVYNANDMNKIIEALVIDVVFNSEWVACVDLGVDTADHRSKSRDEAIRQCVIRALGITDD